MKPTEILPAGLVPKVTFPAFVYLFAYLFAGLIVGPHFIMCAKLHLYSDEHNDPIGQVTSKQVSFVLTRQ